MAFAETKIKDVDWQDYEKQAEKLTKDDLIRFILKRSARIKRDLGKKIEIEKREVKVIDSYIDLVNTLNDEDEHDEERQEARREGAKLYQTNQGKKKQIKVLQKEIEVTQQSINNLRKPLQDLRNKKKEAQNHINPKLVKKVYNYF